jgi:hypothetical protein
MPILFYVSFCWFFKQLRRAMKERWMVEGWNAGNRERQPREVDLGREKAQEKELATIAACYSSRRILFLCLWSSNTQSLLTWALNMTYEESSGMHSKRSTHLWSPIVHLSNEIKKHFLPLIKTSGQLFNHLRFPIRKTYLLQNPSH